MLKSKVSKILGEWLPSIRSVTKKSFNHKNCLLNQEEVKGDKVVDLNKFKNDFYKDTLNNLEKYSHYQSGGCIHSVDKKTMWNMCKG